MFPRFVSLTEADPAALAVIDGETGATASRSELLKRAGTLAADMSAAGLKARDAIGLRLPNSTDFVAAVLAACQLDLVIVPIDRDAPELETATILQHFAAKALVSRSGNGTTIVTREVTTPPAVPSDTRLIKLTSGSTGRPKGVVATEANLVADCVNICRSMQISPTDINLGAIPFSHSYGFSNLVTPLIVQGTPVVASNDYLPQSTLDLANRFACTVAPLIPMVFEHLANAAHGEFETVRTFISAGAPLPPSTSRKFRERFGIAIHTFYGCSECGGITYDREGAAVERGTVGAPLEGVALDLDGSRLRVRSESVACGYLLDASAFTAFDGTFATDDLVEWKESELALTGRMSDLINTAGKKVNPREVEAIILQIEGVREAKVYGEAAGARGEVVAAAIVATPDVTRESVREFCRERLSLHKVPRIVKLIDEMPVDERGKIKRALLAEL
jgi:acyl-CoA synthetase (AMP-forming)/AMP-acid ligase II